MIISLFLLRCRIELLPLLCALLSWLIFPGCVSNSWSMGRLHPSRSPWGITHLVSLGIRLPWTSRMLRRWTARASCSGVPNLLRVVDMQSAPRRQHAWSALVCRGVFQRGTWRNTSSHVSWKVSQSVLVSQCYLIFREFPVWFQRANRLSRFRSVHPWSSSSLQLCTLHASTTVWKDRIDRRSDVGFWSYMIRYGSARLQ